MSQLDGQQYDHDDAGKVSTKSPTVCHTVYAIVLIIIVMVDREEL